MHAAKGMHKKLLLMLVMYEVQICGIKQRGEITYEFMGEFVKNS
jgi:hypothetical protein